MQSKAATNAAEVQLFLQSYLVTQVSQEGQLGMGYSQPLATSPSQLEKFLAHPTVKGIMQRPEMQLNWATWPAPVHVFLQSAEVWQWPGQDGHSVSSRSQPFSTLPSQSTKPGRPEGE